MWILYKNREKKNSSCPESELTGFLPEKKISTEIPFIQIPCILGI